MSVRYTPASSVQDLDFNDFGRLIPRVRLNLLPVRRTSALPPASFRFHLAMDTLAVQLTVPLAGPVRDLNPKESAPCRAHK